MSSFRRYCNSYSPTLQSLLRLCRSLPVAHDDRLDQKTGRRCCVGCYWSCCSRCYSDCNFTDCRNGRVRQRSVDEMLTVTGRWQWPVADQRYRWLPVRLSHSLGGPDHTHCCEQTTRYPPPSLAQQCARLKIGHSTSDVMRKRNGQRPRDCLAGIVVIF